MAGIGLTLAAPRCGHWSDSAPTGRSWPLRARFAAEIRVRPALPCPAPPGHHADQNLHHASETPVTHRRPRRHPADQDVDSRLNLRRCLQPQVQRRSTTVQQAL